MPRWWKIWWKMLLNVIQLMQIYELVSASDLVVQVSGTALLDANPDNENTVSTVHLLFVG